MERPKFVSLEQYVASGGDIVSPNDFTAKVHYEMLRAQMISALGGLIPEIDHPDFDAFAEFVKLGRE